MQNADLKVIWSRLVTNYLQVFQDMDQHKLELIKCLDIKTMQ